MQVDCNEVTNTTEISINCFGLEDGDLPLPDLFFPPGVYNAINIYDSPNLTSMPAYSFGMGVVGRAFSMSYAGVSKFDPNFVGDADLVQHVQSFRMNHIPAE